MTERAPNRAGAGDATTSESSAVVKPGPGAFLTAVGSRGAVPLVTSQLGSAVFASDATVVAAVAATSADGGIAGMDAALLLRTPLFVSDRARKVACVVANDGRWDVARKAVTAPPTTGGALSASTGTADVGLSPQSSPSLADDDGDGRDGGDGLPFLVGFVAAPEGAHEVPPYAATVPTVTPLENGGAVAPTAKDVLCLADLSQAPSGPPDPRAPGPGATARAEAAAGVGRADGPLPVVARIACAEPLTAVVMSVACALPSVVMAPDPTTAAASAHGMRAISQFGTHVIPSSFAFLPAATIGSSTRTLSSRTAVHAAPVAVAAPWAVGFVLVRDEGAATPDHDDAGGAAGHVPFRRPARAAGDDRDIALEVWCRRSSATGCFAGGDDTPLAAGRSGGKGDVGEAPKTPAYECATTVPLEGCLPPTSVRVSAREPDGVDAGAAGSRWQGVLVVVTSVGDRGSSGRVAGGGSARDCETWHDAARMASDEALSASPLTSKVLVFDVTAEAGEVGSSAIVTPLCSWSTSTLTRMIPLGAASSGGSSRRRPREPRTPADPTSIGALVSGSLGGRSVLDCCVQRAYSGSSALSDPFSNQFGGGGSGFGATPTRPRGDRTRGGLSGLSRQARLGPSPGGGRSAGDASGGAAASAVSDVRSKYERTMVAYGTVAALLRRPGSGDVFLATEHGTNERSAWAMWGPLPTLNSKGAPTFTCAPDLLAIGVGNTQGAVEAGRGGGGAALVHGTGLPVVVGLPETHRSAVASSSGADATWRHQHRSVTLSPDAAWVAVQSHRSGARATAPSAILEARQALAIPGVSVWKMPEPGDVGELQWCQTLSKEATGGSRGEGVGGSSALALARADAAGADDEGAFVVDGGPGPVSSVSFGPISVGVPLVVAHEGGGVVVWRRRLRALPNNDAARFASGAGSMAPSTTSAPGWPVASKWEWWPALDVIDPVVLGLARQVWRPPGGRSGSGACAAAASARGDHALLHAGKYQAGSGGGDALDVDVGGGGPVGAAAMHALSAFGSLNGPTLTYVASLVEVERSGADGGGDGMGDDADIALLTQTAGHVCMWTAPRLSWHVSRVVWAGWKHGHTLPAGSTAAVPLRASSASPDRPGGPSSTAVFAGGGRVRRSTGRVGFHALTPPLVAHILAFAGGW